eukprot:10096888-Ditylum_brightwellii.AAC.1
MLLKNYLLAVDINSAKRLWKLFFVAVNPSDVHWQAAAVDSKEAKIYTHCLLGSTVKSVNRILKPLQSTVFLPKKKDGSYLCANDVVALRTLHQPDG